MTERETERQRQTQTQTQRRTDRQTDRQTYKHRYSDSGSQADRDAGFKLRGDDPWSSVPTVGRMEGLCSYHRYAVGNRSSLLASHQTQARDCHTLYSLE